ncbi:MAG: YkgJ family cysteine cluster protein [Methanomicrobiales archaeon]|nr:YkgJ family cysteine cluster protein [Methanomicrobiales archaeon]
MTPGMPSAETLAADIRRVGFSCLRCGACCREAQDDSGLVFASRDEVEALVASGAGAWDEVAEPYPDFTPCGNGSAVTFGWCIRHREGRCSFLSDGGCAAYTARPWICRTYPFALLDGELAVSDCPGLGRPITGREALALARDLLDRARFEQEEGERVREIFPTIRVPEGRRCVVDGSGLRVLGDAMAKKLK